MLDNVKIRANSDRIIRAMSEVLNTDTTRDEIHLLLKLAEDSGKRNTFGVLLKEDEIYQNLLKELQSALKAVHAMEFTQEQRDCVELLLARKNELTYETNVIAYEAGVLDGYQILKVLGVTNE